MRKLLPLTVLALGLSSGVALADHYRGTPRAVVHEHRVAAPVVRDHRDWHGGGVVVQRNWNGSRGYIRSAPVYRGGYSGYSHVVRRPIYVRRPVIRERYFNYYRRPAIVVENYSAMPGYYWVPGAWSWSGYEWIWQPGHYEPDASYIDPSYDASYDSGYVPSDGY